MVSIEEEVLIEEIDSSSSLQANQSRCYVYNHDGEAKLPVIVLTGYLGAGKTTLLNYILQEQREKKIAVIENEVGEVSIDDALVQQNIQSVEHEITVLDNGCICCTIRGDLVRTLESIANRHRGGAVLDGVIIELTGVADPAPVVQTFFASQVVCDVFYVDNVVALVDAKHAISRFSESMQNPSEKGTASAQIAFSSTVLLNKIDLVDEALLADIERHILEINSTVSILRCTNARVPVSKLLNVGIFDLGRVLDEQYMDESEFNQFYEPKMDRSVSNVGIRCTGSINKFALDMFLNKYLGTEETAKDFLRVKAVLDVAGSDRKYVLQSIHMMQNSGFVEAWSKGELRENRIIFIGRNMRQRREALQDGFHACIAKPLRFEIGAEVQVKAYCGGHYDHSDHGHTHTHSQGDSRLVVQMQPGSLGCSILTNGVIENVREGGPVSLAGVPVGWQLVLIDDLAFSFEVLDQKVFGDAAYSLTFGPASEHEYWECGCVLQQWDECNAYRVKLTTGAEILVPLDDDSIIRAGS